MRALLEEQYGPRPWEWDGPAVDVLVGAILSQNTSNANSSAGHERLARRFATWDAVADADARQVEHCIQVSGLSRLKAPRIQGILRSIRAERGVIDLEHLRDRPPREAYDALVRFPGVGPKTAYCVLLFSFGMPVFPVDTHIHRIAIRLGILPDSASADEAHGVLVDLIPPEHRYAMHLLLIAHGRAVCVARNPRCERCCLLRLCPTGQGRLDGSAEAGGSPPRRRQRASRGAKP